MLRAPAAPPAPDPASSGPLFEEEQSFRQPGLWVLLVAGFLLLSGTLAAGLYQQLHLHRAFGSHPLSNRALVVIAIVVLASELLTLVLLAVMRLTVRVDRQFLRVRYRPFFHRRVPLSEIASWQVRTYRPLLEYGGWGIRYGGPRKGWAYNAGGNRGVQIELANGRRFLLGSRRPEELAQALERAGAQRRFT